MPIMKQLEESIAKSAKKGKYDKLRRESQYLQKQLKELKHQSDYTKLLNDNQVIITEHIESGRVSCEDN